MMTLTLPPLVGGRPAPTLPDARQLSIIGGSGAGKTKFMEALTALNSQRAYCLSAVSAPYPEREESTRPGSIDMLFREMAERQPYMRTDAVSELDKLSYMLFVDEFEHLLALKQEHSLPLNHPASKHEHHARLKPTRLDRLVMLWEKVFPGNHIVRERGTMMFSTRSGDDLIPAERLSQSEQTVLYYAAAVLYAMPDAVIFVDSPSLFLHPTVLNSLWNSIEELRPDCTFVYNSVDVEFVSSRTHNVCVWVKSYDAEAHAWDYEVMPPGDVREELFVDLIGTRKPVLFIEGDARHSIDARLYPLVFPDCTVRPLGSCDKVIETTRSFNDLKNMHHLESRGVVDRDRRTDPEVDYLRRKMVMVPEVAEVENLFLLEDVVKGMARYRRRNPDKVFGKVADAIISEFKQRFDEQALQHVRHRVKRMVECRIDARFSCITAMETHLRGLITMLQPRQQYNDLRNEFQTYISRHDYAGILKVFNHKPMLTESGVARLLGFTGKDEYIAAVIAVIKEGGPEGERIRDAIRSCFRVDAPLPERKSRPSLTAKRKEKGAARNKKERKAEKSAKTKRNRRNKNVEKFV